MAHSFPYQYPANKPIPYEPRVLTFRGGLRDSVSDELIKPTEMSAGENYIPDILNAGAITKREGTSATSSVQSEAGTSIHQGKNANYFTTSTKIVNFAGTSLDTGLTTSTAPDWVTFADNDIFCNGTEVRTSTNGSSFGNLGGSPPAFKYMAAHANFVFGAGHSLGTLRWADIGTVATWTASNALTITNDQNDDITALEKYKSALVVFCKNSIHLVNGRNTDDMSILYSLYGVGCTSHRSVVVTPFAIFWWTNSGLAMSRNIGEDILYPLQTKIPGVLNGLNKGVYSLVHGTWNERHKRVEMYCCSSGSTTVDTALYYYYDEVDDTGVGTCWKQTGLGIQAGASGAAVVSGVSDVYTVSAASSSSYLFKQDSTVTTDNGTSITAYAESLNDNTGTGSDSLKKLSRVTLQTVVSSDVTIVYGIYVNGSSGLTKQWSVDLEASGGFVLDSPAEGELDDDALGGTTAIGETPIGWARRFRKIKHRFEDSTADRVGLRAIIHRGNYLAA